MDTNQNKHRNELERIEMKLLLEGIYLHYGFDFRNYASSFLNRRIWNRIREEKVSSISGLQERIFQNPLVMNKLINDFSINVTEMFRDPSFFLSFRKNIISLIKDIPHIRIWHAGCSTGEEIYSTAILLQEEGLFEKTTIYATDMNVDALNVAKTGKFPLNKMQLYTKNYLASGGKRAFSEYYTVKGENAIFHKYLTKNVVFSQHNLATDSSFNEFHVIICRNVMIYFNKVLQNHVFNLINESLCLFGILGLGSKEGIKFTNIEKFYKEVDPFENIYRKIK